MSGMAPMTQGHYTTYRFPRTFAPSANPQIRQRQDEMIHLYSTLHQYTNNCVNVNGRAQFTDGSDALDEDRKHAYWELQSYRREVVNALAQIILLDGAPPPPLQAVDNDIHEFLGLPRLLDAAYTAAGRAPPPPAQGH